MKIENTAAKNDCGFMILPDGKYYSLDDRMTHMNNNVLIVGTTGASKTRNFVIPNICEAVGSYVVTDPKGNLYRKLGGYLRKKGYKVQRVSFVHPEKSVKYNPFAFLRTSQQIQEMSYILIGCKAEQSKDHYWDDMATMLLNAVIGYLVETRPVEERTFTNVIKLLRASAKSGDDPDEETVLKVMLDALRSHNPGSWAADQFEFVSGIAERTYNCIYSSAISGMNTFATRELDTMLQGNEVDFASIGRQKTAVFVEVSDTDRSMDRLINLFFTQAINQLCSYADEKCYDNQLPVPVRFIMDDFATNCRIQNFENMISNIRSRKISTAIVLQSMAQLKAGYGDDAQTIIDDCDTLIYMGGNNPDTAQAIGRRCGKTEDTLLHMPLGTSWIIRRGQKPFNCRNFDVEDYLKAKREGRMFIPNTGGERI